MRPMFPTLVAVLAVAACEAPADEGGPADPTGTDELGPCEQYIQCVEALGEPTASLEAEFGPEGSCWDGTQDAQVSCRATCEDQVAILASENPGVSACQPVAAGCADEPVGTGYDVDDVAYDFVAEDGYGQTWQLYGYCDSTVLLVFTASWMSPSWSFAPDVQDWYDIYADDGFFPILLLGENEEERNPTAEDLRNYAESLQLTYPVVEDPGFELLLEFSGAGSVELPYGVLLEPGAVVVVKGEVSEADVTRHLP